MSEYNCKTDRCIEEARNEQLRQDARRDEFTHLLQAHASRLLNDEQAAAVLRSIRPEWFADAK